VKVLFLSGGFPSIDNPTKSIFNYRAAKSLRKKIGLTVIHLRYWKPNRKFKVYLKYKDVNVIQLSLPWIPVENSLLNSFNLFLWKYFCNFFLKNELSDIDVIHSVGIDGAASIGSYIKKKDTKHIAQTIGSDLNFHWDKLKRHGISQGWEKNVDVFLCNSKALERKINLEFPKNKSITIYRGTNLDKFEPNDTDHKINKIKVLYLGGFSNRKSTSLGRDLKGGETLKTVWKNIENNITNKRVELILGGPNSTELELQEWKNTLDYKDKVICKGLIDSEKIPSLIQSVDIVVIPSKAEGLPNIAVEALACEKLVIASNIGGIPEIVKDKNTGYLFDSNSLIDFQNILLKSIINFKDTIVLRKNARKLVENNFDASKYPEKLINLYSSL
jgi:glycosyltransferase involved in cell wall biosynthesis